MSTINRAGRRLAYACIVSLVANGIACSVSDMSIGKNMVYLLVWTYTTLFVLVIAIFMAQHEPYTPEE